MLPAWGMAAAWLPKHPKWVGGGREVHSKCREVTSREWMEMVPLAASRLPESPAATITGAPKPIRQINRTDFMLLLKENSVKSEKAGGKSRRKKPVKNLSRVTVHVPETWKYK